MNNITDYVQSENKKTSINQIIRDTFPNIEDHEKATDLVYDKLKLIDELRDVLRSTSAEQIKKSLEAENNKSTTPEKVIDAIVYLSIVVENVWLMEELKKLKSE